MNGQTLPESSEQFSQLMKLFQQVEAQVEKEITSNQDILQEILERNQATAAF